MSPFLLDLNFDIMSTFLSFGGGSSLNFFLNPVGGSAHSEDALIPEVNYNQTRRGRGRENTPLIG